MQGRDLRAIGKSQRRSLLAAGHALNTYLDVMFYDVSSLTQEEQARLSPRSSPEGSILIVHPRAESQDIAALSPLQFIAAQRRAGPAAIDAMVVAGVGSSALGTAALARNVADYLARPVAGVVSGFGVADALTEALGGWFVLGFKNSIRDTLAKLFDALDMKDHVWDDESYRSLVKDKEIAGFDMDRFVFGSPDAAALLLALYHLQPQIRILVGHSKGNYVIENALEGLISLCTLKKQSIPTDLQIVTLGAVVRFPEEFSDVRQFVGTFDGFGMINSRPQSHPSWIAGAWHSLNTNWVGHMSVQEVLELAGVQ